MYIVADTIITCQTGRQQCENCGILVNRESISACIYALKKIKFVHDSSYILPALSQHSSGEIPVPDHVPIKYLDN